MSGTASGGKTTFGPSSEGVITRGARANEAEFGPIRDVLANQIQEILFTGGSGALIPQIQRSVEGTRQAVSSHLRNLEGDIAAQDLGGSSYARSIQAAAEVAGAQQVAGAPYSALNAFLQSALPILTGIHQNTIGAATSPQSKTIRQAIQAGAGGGG